MLILSRCERDPAWPLSLDEQIAALEQPLVTLPPVPEPPDNLATVQKVRLGKLLFWDPIISGEKDVACASCHHPAFGYADGLDLSIGVGGKGLGPSRQETASDRIPRIGRSAPTVINAAYIGMKDYHQPFDPLSAPMFWDSRVKSLEAQCLGPPASRSEMAGDAYAAEFALDSVMARLQNIPAYAALFDSVFGGGIQAITREHFSKAIAAFERTLISNNSPYDQYVKGDKNALSERQKKGLLLFFTDANCSSCHRGPMFSDFKLTIHGAKDNPGGNFPDIGGEGDYQFKTPTLRNIELTAPYTHGGMYKTLREALQFYNAGRSENPKVPDSRLDIHVEPINLPDEDLEDIIEFLKALTDDSFDQSIPSSVPSGLHPGGNIF